jgi:hypothetical protein
MPIVDYRTLRERADRAVGGLGGERVQALQSLGPRSNSRVFTPLGAQAGRRLVVRRAPQSRLQSVAGRAPQTRTTPCQDFIRRCFDSRDQCREGCPDYEIDPIGHTKCKYQCHLGEYNCRYDAINSDACFDERCSVGVDPISICEEKTRWCESDEVHDKCVARCQEEDPDNQFCEYDCKLEGVQCKFDVIEDGYCCEKPADKLRWARRNQRRRRMGF